MNLMTNLETFLLRFGKLNDYGRAAARIASDVPRYRLRKRMAQELLAADVPSLTIDPQRGYLLTSAERIEGLKDLMPTLTGFEARKLAELDLLRLMAQRRDEGRPLKQFYFNIMSR